MAELTFWPPVQVEANGLLREITSIQEARAFLRRWPIGRRGPVYACAERSCNAATAGQMSVEQARQAFISFARIAGVLVRTEPTTPRPSRKKAGAPRDAFGAGGRQI